MAQQTRRQFLRRVGALALPFWLPLNDWESESPAAARIHQNLNDLFDGLNMALDFRCIDTAADYTENFRIQIRADQLYPVASCFKAFAVLYYFMNTPPDEWIYDEYSVVYQMAVLSDNAATGLLLDNVARRLSGPENAIEKFNDFLRLTVGLSSGLHTWNWEGTPTAGLSDPRYAPSRERLVWVNDTAFQVDNVFTAADLARGHDFITRGEFFTRSDEFREAVRMTKALLSIPLEKYESPIERVFEPGYTGKDGILPAADVATGRVINDAGALHVGNHIYIVAFMSAGESETTAINVLGEVINQINIYELDQP